MVIAVGAPILASDIGGPWAPYAPTLTNVTVGNGAITARYKRIDKTVFFQTLFLFGSTSAITGSVTVGLPVAPRLITSVSANVFFLDDLVGWFPGSWAPSGSGVVIRATNTSGAYATATPLSSTAPFTWTTNDYFNVSGFYEVV